MNVSLSDIRHKGVPTMDPPLSAQVVVDALATHYDPLISKKLKGLYLVGSRLYGTATPESDWDFLAILDQEPLPTQQDYTEEHISSLPLPPTHQLQVFELGDLNVSLYSLEHFELLVCASVILQANTQQLQEHRILALEVLFLPKEFVTTNWDSNLTCSGVFRRASITTIY